MEVLEEMLVGEVRAWWTLVKEDAERQDEPNDWEDIQEEMLKEFGVDGDTTLRAYADVKEAPGEGLWSFAHRLKQLTNNIEFVVQEDQLIQKFIRGLRNKVVASFVNSKNPRNLKEATKIAGEMKGVMAYEKAQKALPDQEEPDRGTPFKGKRHRQEEVVPHKSQRHRVEKVKDRNNIPTRSYTPCQHCGMTTHQGKTCWFLKKLPGDHNRNNIPTGTTMIGIESLNQRAKGLRACKLVTNDNQTLTAIIDTDSSFSLISPLNVERLKSATHTLPPKPTSVINASGNADQCKEIVSDTSRLQGSDTQHQIQFLVHPRLPVDALL